MDGNYDVKYFSISLPKDEQSKTISKLLRHLADELEKQENIVIQDIAYHCDEQDDYGNDWPYLSVYYQKN